MASMRLSSRALKTQRASLCADFLRQNLLPDPTFVKRNRGSGLWERACRPQLVATLMVLRQGLGLTGASAGPPLVAALIGRRGRESVRERRRPDRTSHPSCDLSRDCPA